MTAIKKQSLEDYLLEPGVSKHGLDYFRRSAAHYHDHMTGRLKNPVTDAMTFGTLIHSAILEGRRDYVVQPETYLSAAGELKPWSNNATVCREWTAGQTRPVLTLEEHTLVVQAMELVRTDPVTADLLRGAEIEMSLFGTLAGLPIKGRLDAFNRRQRALIDLKKTRDAGDAAFARDLYKYGYHRQAGLYQILAEQNGLELPDFIFILIETGEVPRLNLRRLSAAAIQQGRREIEADLRRLARCYDEDNWPGYFDGKIQVINLPSYARNMAEPVAEPAAEPVPA